MGRVHIGTMGWSYSFWVGNVYPEGLRPSEFLAEYSKHFDTVEADSTFYRVPSSKTLDEWGKQTPGNFIFSAKFPQTISHRKMLKDSEHELEFFLERLSKLQNKLGPLLLQFPPAFGPEKLTLLKDFLASLPPKNRYAVEVRNTKLLGDRLYLVLRENKIALTQAVGPFIPEVDQITADFVYIRWEGDRTKVNGTLGKVEVDRADEIKKWADKISRLVDAGKEVFGYFSKYYSGAPTRDAKTLIELLSHHTTTQRTHSQNSTQRTA